MQKFKENNGIDYILELFKEKDVLALSANTSLKYSTVMIVLIEEFFKFSFDLEEVFIQKLLDCLLVIGKYSEDPEDEEIATVARSAKSIFTEIFRKNKEIITESLTNYNKISDLIEFSLLCCKNKYYPNLILNLFLEITTNNSVISEFMVRILFDKLNIALCNNRSFCYWSLLTHIIRENLESQDLRSELRKIKVLLRKHPPELSGKEKDMVL